jgi:hypothetical protein
MSDSLPPPPDTPPNKRGFWTGAAAGLLVASVVAAVVVVAVRNVGHRSPTVAASPPPSPCPSARETLIDPGPEQAAYRAVKADEAKAPHASAAPNVSAALATDFRLIASDDRAWADALEPDDPVAATHATRAADAWDSAATSIANGNAAVGAQSYVTQAGQEEKLAGASISHTLLKSLRKSIDQKLRATC